MNEQDDFEAMLAGGMRESTDRVYATPELQEQLLAGSLSTSQLVRRAASSPFDRLPFRTPWAVPAAAAAVVALIAGGTALLVHQDGTSAPAVAESAAVSGATSATVSKPADPSTSTAPTHVSSRPPASPIDAGRTTAAATTAAASTTASTTAHRTPAPSAGKTSPQPGGFYSPTPTSSGVQPEVPSTCTQADTGAYHPTSVADFVSHMEGTWLACTYPTIFDGDEVGIVIRPDGTWAKLTRDSSNNLIAGTSSLTKGTWTTIDDSAMNGKPTYQIDFAIAGAGTIVTIPTFSTGVTRIRMDNNGSFHTSYVPNP